MSLEHLAMGVQAQRAALESTGGVDDRVRPHLREVTRCRHIDRHCPAALAVQRDDTRAENPSDTLVLQPAGRVLVESHARHTRRRKGNLCERSAQTRLQVGECRGLVVAGDGRNERLLAAQQLLAECLGEVCAVVRTIHRPRIGEAGGVGFVGTGG